MTHPLSESLRETAHQQTARADVLLLAADELDRLAEENEALHRNVDSLVDDLEFYARRKAGT